MFFGPIIGLELWTPFNKESYRRMATPSSRPSFARAHKQCMTNSISRMRPNLRARSGAQSRNLGPKALRVLLPPADEGDAKSGSGRCVLALSFKVAPLANEPTPARPAPRSSAGSSSRYANCQRSVGRRRSANLLGRRDIRTRGAVKICLYNSQMFCTKTIGLMSGNASYPTDTNIALVVTRN